MIIIIKVKETQRETETSSGINEGCMSTKISLFYGLKTGLIN